MPEVMDNCCVVAYRRATRVPTRTPSLLLAVAEGGWVPLLFPWFTFHRTVTSLY